MMAGVGDMGRMQVICSGCFSPWCGAQCGGLSPNNFPNVGGDEIADELLHVVVNGPALLDG